MAVKKNSTFPLFLLLVTTLFAESSVPVRRFVYVKDMLTWPNAQYYCRKHHTDLATIRNPDEAKAPLNLSKTGGWIGLSWSWSGGERVGFTRWRSGNNTGYGCVHSGNAKGRLWRMKPCDSQSSFFCYDEEMFLVKEKKSWEEALEHCRSVAGDLYDLVSLTTEEEHRQARDQIQEALTDQIWTGLRFLGDQWLWVSGKALTYRQLPLCPARWRHCGALAKNGSAQWEVRDCTERRYFLCRRRAPIGRGQGVTYVED